MKRFVIITTLLLACCGVSTAQLETAVWYFGRNAGLDFNTPEPKVLLDGQIKDGLSDVDDGTGHRRYHGEGMASFSDSLGHVRLYTDGRSVWNAAHEVMPNGNDLLGDISSTESAIIVPWPGDLDRYFVFVIDAQFGKNGLSYSVVDMNLDGGRGDIVEGQKNIMLEGPDYNGSYVCEKVTAIKHANGHDFWLLTRTAPGNNVVRYLVDKDGVNMDSRTEFPISALDIGFQYDREGKPYFDETLAIGYMRVSPNGRLVACANGGASLKADIDGEKKFVNLLEVFKFDPRDGSLEPFVTHLDTVSFLYGVEFSSDITKLYYTSRRKVFQMDLMSDDPETISNSTTFIGEFPKQGLVDTLLLGALQLAINGKIYVAQDSYPYLGVIENPCEKGQACNYVIDGKYLEGKFARLGLPNFIPTYLLPPDFEIVDNCTNKITTFRCTDERDVDSYKWKLTSASGEVLAESNEREFSLPLVKSDKYRISLEVVVDGFSHVDYRFFEVYEPPTLNLGDDVQICSYEEAVIPAPESGADFTFNWADGGNDDLHITKSSEIRGFLTDNYTGCTIDDVIKVVVVDPVEFQLPEALEFCSGKTVAVDVVLDEKIADFQWLDGDSKDLKRFFDKPGDYTAKTVDVEGCEFTRTVKITENPLPKISFEGDNIICANKQRVLDCGIGDVAYLWNTGATTRTITPDAAGWYKVTVTDKKLCVSTDSIEMELKTLPQISLPPDTVMCDGNTLTLNAAWYDAYNYQWQDFSGGEEYVVEQPGTFSVVVNNYCGETSDEIFVRYRYCGEFIFPNIITPNGDGVNDYFKIKGLDEFVNDWSIDIYNREGRRVFHSDNYHNEWNAPDVKDGVYFYVFYKEGERYSGNISVFHR